MSDEASNRGGSATSETDNLLSDKDGSEDERQRKLCCICSCSACLICALPCFLLMWLVTSLIAGSPVNSEFKHPFAGTGTRRSIALDSIDGGGPFIVGTAPLPSSLQGLFWLTDQGKSTGLISFGGPNADNVTGGGERCSTGRISKGYCVRVSGDRVWSLASPVLSFVYATHDIKYVFTFDDPERPTHATIDPYADWSGLLPGYNLFWFSTFEMTLLAAGHPDFNGSVVWERASKMPFKTSYYNAVQVVDGAGRRIEPAWTRFVEYEKREVGTDVLWYHSYE